MRVTAWRVSAAAIVLSASIVMQPSQPALADQVLHGVAIHGTVDLPPDFKHLPYADPNAKKGGTLVIASIGTFDNFNPFTLKGNLAPGLSTSGRARGAQVFHERLGQGSWDEPGKEYAYLAESFTVPEDRSWIEFKLRDDIFFSDGSPITVEDAIWTFNTLKSDGHPEWRFYFGNIEAAVKTGERSFRFQFAGTPNNELPVIASEMPVLSKAYWEGRDLGDTKLEQPVSSGPYRIEDFEVGRSITFVKNPDWWGKDHPINVGRWNWERIRYEFYRDGDIAFEAFKAGEFDYRGEASTKNWVEGYNVPALEDGVLIKATKDAPAPEPMQGWVMNQRNPLFQDIRVREALGYFYDFETLNKTLYYGLMSRPTSFYWDSELAATGLPEGRELEILEEFRGQLPEDVFTEVYEPPKTDGSGNIRPQLRQALRLFREAGWSVKDGKMVNAEGEQFSFEILLPIPRLERIALPYKANLERAGIAVTIRTVDSAQYVERVESFDFDMIVGLFGQSQSPGNEQREYWSCAAAERPGSRNTPGICDPVVDKLIERLIEAESREDLIMHVRALDRVLLHGHHLIPQQRNRESWFAYWDRFGRPEQAPTRTTGFFSTWWIEPDRSAAVDAYLGR